MDDALQTTTYGLVGDTGGADWISGLFPNDCAGGEFAERNRKYLAFAASLASGHRDLDRIISGGVGTDRRRIATWPLAR